jgi:hypothetical protein
MQVDEDLVLSDDNTLKAVGDMWNGNKRLIVLVLQARINAIGKKILENAIPEEVIVLRQSLVELGALVTDFERYQAEATRRATHQEEIPQNPDVQEVPAKPPEEGQEGSM